MAKQLQLFDLINSPSFVVQNEVFPDVESDEVEFKSAKGGFPQDFWKTYSAFANSNGGIIVLGVKEKKGKFTYDGLDDDQIIKYQKEFWNNANNPNTVSINLLKNEDVCEFILDNKKVLVFHVPPAERNHKPVHLTPNPFKNTYKRNYEGDYCCKDEEIRRMLADADLSFSPDSRILVGYSMSDIDVTSLQQYRRLFASLRPSHPWLSLDDRDFLEQLGGYRKDRNSKNQGFTLAGVLMFGKHLSIVDEECCPKFFPDYRELSSDTDETRWADRIFPDGTWECNLFQFYRLVYPKISSRLPKPFQLVQGQRQDDTPAHIAIREAFVNSLVHTDYSAPGSIIIKSTPNSFSFVNPGTLLVTISQFYEGGISQCRNTNLQKMFLMIGGAEKAGSGVSKIMAGWDASHWRRPYLIIDTNPDRISLEMPMFSIIPEDTLYDLKILFGDIVETLGKDQLTALAVCHIEGEITNTRLQYLINKHKTDITKMLQELCKNEYLISENKSRWTTYKLNPYHDNNTRDDIPISENRQTVILNVDSSNVDSSNVDSSNVDSSNVDSSNVDSSNVDSSSSSTKEFNIPKRMEYTQLVKEIIRFCSLDYKSSEQIAIHINRSEKYLKNNILSKMIKDGKLFKLYSDNHPNQKYIAKK